MKGKVKSIRPPPMFLSVAMFLFFNGQRSYSKIIQQQQNIKYYVIKLSCMRN